MIPSTFKPRQDIQVCSKKKVAQMERIMCMRVCVTFAGTFDARAFGVSPAETLLTAVSSFPASHEPVLGCVFTAVVGRSAVSGVPAKIVIAVLPWLKHR